MALFIKQSESRSQLQEKLVAELQEKAKKKSLQGDDFDIVNDSQFIKSTKQTSSLAGIWIVLGAIVIILLVWLTLAG